MNAINKLFNLMGPLMLTSISLLQTESILRNLNICEVFILTQTGSYHPRVIMHSISNRKFFCFSCIIAMEHQNLPTVEFLKKKIESNLRRANTLPSVDFRRANTEPSVDFRKANTEPSVHFRRANTETYWK